MRPRTPGPLLRPGTALGVPFLLSAVVVALIAQSAAGLVVDGLYPEEIWAVTALRANDLVTLILVALSGVLLWQRVTVLEIH